MANVCVPLQKFTVLMMQFLFISVAALEGTFAHFKPLQLLRVFCIQSYCCIIIFAVLNKNVHLRLYKVYEVENPYLSQLMPGLLLVRFRLHIVHYWNHAPSSPQQHPPFESSMHLYSAISKKAIYYTNYLWDKWNNKRYHYHHSKVYS